MEKANIAIESGKAKENGKESKGNIPGNVISLADVRNQKSQSFMPYTQFGYLYPTRPENHVMPGLLGFYEKQNWIAQIKKCGVCGLIIVSPSKEITVMNRHNEVHKLWKPTNEIETVFKSLPNKWYVFCAEILDSKTKHIKNTVYLFDMLVSDNQLMIGSTYIDRYNKMKNLFKIRGTNFQYDIVNDQFWIANNHPTNFLNIFNSLTSPEDEGLVLKNPQGKLELPYKPTANSGWQVKCRKGNKSYGF